MREGCWRSQESYLISWSVEFIDFYRVGFLLVPPIVPPNDFACGERRHPKLFFGLVFPL